VLGRVFDAASTSYARVGPDGAPHHLQSCLVVTEHGGIHAHQSDVNTLSGVNATKPIVPLFHLRTPAACVCKSVILCVQTDALPISLLRLSLLVLQI